LTLADGDGSLRFCFWLLLLLLLLLLPPLLLLLLPLLLLPLLLPLLLTFSNDSHTSRAMHAGDA